MFLHHALTRRLTDAADPRKRARSTPPLPPAFEDGARRPFLRARIAGTHRYILTTYGLKTAVFNSQLYLRILRPARGCLEAPTRNAPDRLHRALQRLQDQIDRLGESARPVGPRRM